MPFTYVHTTTLGFFFSTFVVLKQYRLVLRMVVLVWTSRWDISFPNTQTFTTLLYQTWKTPTHRTVTDNSLPYWHGNPMDTILALQPHSISTWYAILIGPWIPSQMVGQIQHGSVFPIQLGEMDTNTPTNQTSSRFCIPSLTTYSNKTPNTKQFIRINNFVLGIQEKQGKRKTQETSRDQSNANILIRRWRWRYSR